MNPGKVKIQKSNATPSNLRTIPFSLVIHILRYATNEPLHFNVMHSPSDTRLSLYDDKRWDFAKRMKSKYLSRLYWKFETDDNGSVIFLSRQIVQVEVHFEEGDFSTRTPLLLHKYLPTKGYHTLIVTEDTGNNVHWYELKNVVYKGLPKSIKKIRTSMVTVDQLKDIIECLPNLEELVAGHVELYEEALKILTRIPKIEIQTYTSFIFKKLLALCSAGCKLRSINVIPYISLGRSIGREFGQRVNTFLYYDWSVEKDENEKKEIEERKRENTEREEKRKQGIEVEESSDEEEEDENRDDPMLAPPFVEGIHSLRSISFDSSTIGSRSNLLICNYFFGDPGFRHELLEKLKLARNLTKLHFGTETLSFAGIATFLHQNKSVKDIQFDLQLCVMIKERYVYKPYENNVVTRVELQSFNKLQRNTKNFCEKFLSNLHGMEHLVVENKGGLSDNLLMRRELDVGDITKELIYCIRSVRNAPLKRFELRLKGNLNPTVVTEINSCFTKLECLCLKIFSESANDLWKYVMANKTIRELHFCALKSLKMSELKVIATRNNLQKLRFLELTKKGREFIMTFCQNIMCVEVAVRPPPIPTRAFWGSMIIRPLHFESFDRRFPEPISGFVNLNKDIDFYSMKGNVNPQDEFMCKSVKRWNIEAPYDWKGNWKYYYRVREKLELLKGKMLKRDEGESWEKNMKDFFEKIEASETKISKEKVIANTYFYEMKSDGRTLTHECRVYASYGTTRYINIGFSQWAKRNVQAFVSFFVDKVPDRIRAKDEGTYYDIAKWNKDYQNDERWLCGFGLLLELMKRLFNDEGKFLNVLNFFKFLYYAVGIDVENCDDEFRTHWFFKEFKRKFHHHLPEALTEEDFDEEEVTYY